MYDIAHKQWAAWWDGLVKGIDLEGNSA
jgi:hypothetical protein